MSSSRSSRVTIVTVTPNPSLDRTQAIDRLERGEVIRTTGSSVEPGGKGINVARALTMHGVGTVAVVPVGGAEGAQLCRLLDADGIAHHAVEIAGAVRTNTSLVEPDGTVTKVNERGPQLDGDEVAALLDAVARADADAAPAWVVGCGSLPQGVATDLYAGLVRLGHDLGARVAIDTSGAPLTATLGAGPDLVKPNVEELAGAAAMPIRTFGDVVAACEKLRADGARTVIASLGRDGAILVDDDTVVHATSPVERPVSNVAAGDATLAGFLTADARGASGADALALAVAFGAGAVQQPGSALPGPDDLRPGAVQVTHDLDLERHLSEEG